VRGSPYYENVIKTAGPNVPVKTITAVVVFAHAA